PSLPAPQYQFAGRSDRAVILHCPSPGDGNWWSPRQRSRAESVFASHLISYTILYLTSGILCANILIRQEQLTEGPDGDGSIAGKTGCVGAPAKCGGWRLRQHLRTTHVARDRTRRAHAYRRHRARPGCIADAGARSTIAARARGVG